MTAAAGGLLDETHWVELKQDLPTANKATNTELARDLASLAVDGGLYVVGVEEDHLGRAGAVVGADLTRLAERIDAVARSRIDPPLVVRAHPEIEDPKRPGHGVLLVEVPPSGQAPHMVDNVYYGRGDRAKMTLSDPQVREIMERRLLARADMPARLQDLVDQDPLPAGSSLRNNAHLYLVAHPVTAREDALLDFLNNNPAPDLANDVHRAVSAAKALATWPNLTIPGEWHRRSAGYTATSGLHDPAKVREGSLMMLTVQEDGGLTLLCGGGTTLDSQMNIFTDRKAPMVVPLSVIGLIYAALVLAGDLADRKSGYQGQWQLGLLLGKLRGAVAADYLHPGSGWDVHPYDRDTYEQVTESTTVELVEHPEAVTERLIGRLLRGLVVDKKYLPLSPPETSR